VSENNYRKKQERRKCKQQERRKLAREGRAHVTKTLNGARERQMTKAVKMLG